MSASGKARVTSPAPQRRLRSREQHRRGETDRVDAVRIVHKTANVLNKVPKSVQRAMKADLHEIHGAPTRAAAEAALDIFAEKYGSKCARAVECLTKDRQVLLAFYDLPAEHWDYLR